VSLHREPPSGSPRNVSRGIVGHVELLGDRARVRVDGDIPFVAEVTASSLHELGLAEGTPVWTAVKATEITVFPA
jgi:molybdopterin-binding protein